MTTLPATSPETEAGASTPAWGPRLLLLVENVALARDHRLQKQVASLTTHGYRVSVICRSDPGNQGFDGVSVHEYPAPCDARSRLGFVCEYGYSWAMAAWLTLKIFRAERFDAIQVSGTPDIYFTIGAPFKLMRKPLVLDQRDLSPELYEARYGSRGPILHALRVLERASYRTADHVITVNRALERIAYLRGALPPQSVSVVGNGPLLARTHRRAPRSGFKQGRRFLCCWVGMMGPQDRVDLALRAIHHLVHSRGRKDCHFAFLGDGEAREALERLAEELDIRDWVTFPGWLGEEAIFTYLSTADLGLEPNLMEVVSPVKAMEYMAFAVPFVAFDLSQTKALAGGAAAYAPPGDVVALAGLVDRLLGDPARRAEMGRKGRRRVEDHVAWDHQEPAYLGVYERLLGRGHVTTKRTMSVSRPCGRDAGNTAQAAPVSLVRRARHRLRTRAAENPTLYLPFARRKYPGPSPEVISSETQLVIDGYTRAGTTFAVYAFQLAQPEPVRLAHHLHAPAQVIEAARKGIPALVLIRDPQATILSQLVREPEVEFRDALLAYSRFYSRLLPYRGHFVVGDFEDVTRDFGAVIRRLNARFGTSFEEFVHTDASERQCLELMRERASLSRILLGFESGVVSLAEVRSEQERLAQQPMEAGAREAWIPSRERERAKAALQRQWLRPDLAKLRERAQATYRVFLAG